MKNPTTEGRRTVMKLLQVLLRGTDDISLWVYMGRYASRTSRNKRLPASAGYLLDD